MEPELYSALALGAQNPKPKKIHSTTADNAQFLIVFSGLWSTACIPHQIERRESLLYAFIIVAAHFSRL
jgi:hypothetical protein